jgi:hypothetical protein
VLSRGVFILDFEIKDHNKEKSGREKYEEGNKKTVYNFQI